MGRIRSIKPEFWTDATVTDLSAECALFFVALWNFATDQGVFENDTRALSLLIPRYRSQVIKPMLSSLWKAGLIVRSRDAELWLVTGWAHQKIDRPKAGKWNPSEIEWVSWDPSMNDRESSSMNRRKDRIGSDRIGSDQDRAKDPKPENKKPDIEGENVRAFISAYCDAFRDRYNTTPDITGKDAGIAKRVVKDLGTSRAIALAHAYLSMTDGFYLTKRHDLVTFESNLKAIAVKLDTGQSFNRVQSRQQEVRDANVDAVKAYLESKRAL